MDILDELYDTIIDEKEDVIDKIASNGCEELETYSHTLELIYDKIDNSTVSNDIDLIVHYLSQYTFFISKFDIKSIETNNKKCVLPKFSDKLKIVTYEQQNTIVAADVDVIKKPYDSYKILIDFSVDNDKIQNIPRFVLKTLIMLFRFMNNKINNNNIDKNLNISLTVYEKYQKVNQDNEDNEENEDDGLIWISRFTKEEIYKLLNIYDDSKTFSFAHINHEFRTKFRDVLNSLIYIPINKGESDEFYKKRIDGTIDLFTNKELFYYANKKKTASVLMSGFKENLTVFYKNMAYDFMQIQGTDMVSLARRIHILWGIINNEANSWRDGLKESIYCDDLYKCHMYYENILTYNSKYHDFDDIYITMCNKKELKKYINKVNNVNEHNFYETIESLENFINKLKLDNVFDNKNILTDFLNKYFLKSKDKIVSSVIEDFANKKIETPQSN